MLPPIVDPSVLPPEERDLVLQLGKISRPFAHDPRDPLWRRTLALYKNMVTLRAWEVLGVDVSYWNGNIDWSILSQYAVFAFIRYGYGNDWVDPSASVNAKGALDHKVAYDGYWYLTMKNEQRTAETFYTTRTTLGGQMYPAFDLEVTGGLGKTMLANWVVKCVNRYCELAHSDHSRTLLYTSKGFYDRYVERGFLKNMLLWVANWTTYPEPLLPSDWKTWKFWQYAVAQTPGSGNTDQNRYNGSAAAFQNEFDVTLPPPKPPPGDEDMIAKVIAEPSLNVRAGPGTNFADIGDLPTGATFKIKDVVSGTPTCSIWLQIKEGQFAEMWACLYINGSYLAKIVQPLVI